MILSVKKVFAMSIVVSLLGVIATWGLKTLTFEEIIGPVEAYTTYGPIKLTMRLDKNTFRLGEEVNVTVIITNISNETIALGYHRPLKTDIAVYNSSSDRIFLYSRTVVTATEGVVLFLEPSESYSRTIKWNQLQVDDVPPFATRQVQLGIYYITGRTGPVLYYLGPKDEWREEESQGIITVETPQIEIQIL